MFGAVSTAGNGGNGLFSSITGVSTVYCGGGGGSALPTIANPVGGVGGTGGGGAGAFINNTSGENAAQNSGGGGGGGCGSDAVDRGGDGSRGVVIVAYPDINPTLIVGGGLSFSTPLSRPGYHVYIFSGGDGTFQLPV